MKIRLLFFVLFFQTLSLISQSKGEQSSAVIGNNDDFFFVRDGINILKKDFNNNTLDSLIFNEKYPSKSFKLVIQNNAPVIVNKGGGMVWKVKNDTFTRVDNSFDHKMTNASSVFIHNDTIMKFGGYGYWSSRNFITYFSKTTKEWEIYSINPNSLLPPGVSSVNYSYINNKGFYFSDGLKSSPKYPLNKTLNDQIWYFDFRNKSWEDLGTSKSEYIVESQILKLGNGQMLVGSTYGSAVSSDQVYLYDFINNNIERLNSFNQIFGIDSAFVANDSLYNYRNNNLIGFDLKSYITESTDEGSLYVDTNALFANLTRFTGVAIILLFIIVLYLYSKNRKRPRLSETGFRFNRVHYPLTEKELSILKLILYNKRVESKIILKEIYDSELSVAQNNRRKVEIVESLNKKVSTTMNINKFINSKKSLKDQRVLIYYSNFRTDFVL
jgi:preprotein translocase subunit SecG